MRQIVTLFWWRTSAKHSAKSRSLEIHGLLNPLLDLFNRNFEFLTIESPRDCGIISAWEIKTHEDAKSRSPKRKLQKRPLPRWLTWCGKLRPARNAQTNGRTRLPPFRLFASSRFREVGAAVCGDAGRAPHEVFSTVARSRGPESDGRARGLGGQSALHTARLSRPWPPSWPRTHFARFPPASLSALPPWALCFRQACDLNLPRPAFVPAAPWRLVRPAVFHWSLLSRIP